MNDECWACRQSKCNRCVGCVCGHTKDQYVKPEKSNADMVADTMGKLLMMKRDKQNES